MAKSERDSQREQGKTTVIHCAQGDGVCPGLCLLKSDVKDCILWGKQTALNQSSQGSKKNKQANNINKHGPYHQYSEWLQNKNIQLSAKNDETYKETEKCNQCSGTKPGNKGGL